MKSFYFLFSIFIVLFVWIITSCSKNTDQQDLYNSETSTGNQISQTGIVISSEIIEKMNIPKSTEKILESWENFLVIETSFINIINVPDSKVELFYIKNDWSKILIAETWGWEIFKNVKIEGNYIFYTFSGTWWEVINIIDLTHYKKVAWIRFWIYTDDKKYMFSCSEWWYWPGEAAIIDLSEMKSYNAFSYLYKKISDNTTDGEFYLEKCEQKIVWWKYFLEFIGWVWYSPESKKTTYTFDFASKKIINQSTKEEMIIPVESYE